MNAIYKGKLYHMGDDLNQATLIGEDEDVISVDYGDPELIIDPTDDQINNMLPEG